MSRYFPSGWSTIASKWDGLCAYTAHHGSSGKALCNVPSNTHSWRTAAQSPSDGAGQARKLRPVPHRPPPRQRLRQLRRPARLHKDVSQPRCGRDAAEMQPRCSRAAAEIAAASTSGASPGADATRGSLGRCPGSTSRCGRCLWTQAAALWSLGERADQGACLRVDRPTTSSAGRSCSGWARRQRRRCGRRAAVTRQVAVSESSMSVHLGAADDARLARSRRRRALSALRLSALDVWP